MCMGSVRFWVRFVYCFLFFFFFQAEDGIRDLTVTGVQTCALPISDLPVWVSEMTVDPPHREIRYRHVQGITRGMDVIWRLRGTGGIEAQRHGGTVRAVGTVAVEIVHSWDGPGWPLIGRAAAALVIGPVFVHGIAVRTLAGIKRFAEGAQ